MMNDIFHSYFNKFIQIYLNNILIFLKSIKKHIKHVQIILKTLSKHELFAKLKKCELKHINIKFCDYIINNDYIKLCKVKMNII